jgi:AcrR family transcriptional regulator
LTIDRTFDKFKEPFLNNAIPKVPFYVCGGRTQMPVNREKKDELFEAALSLFAEKGFQGTSIRDLAGACNTSISNLYHHFGSKEGLLVAILDRYSGELLEALREATNGTTDPLESFKALLATHVRMAWSRTREGKISFQDEEHLTPEGRDQSRKIQREILEIYRQHLLALQKLGLLRVTNLTVLAFNIFGVINWFLRWYRPGGPLSLEEAANEVVAFALYGALVQGPEQTK